MKRAMKGDFKLFDRAAEMYEKASSLTDGKTGNENWFQEKVRYIDNFKKAILIAIHGVNTKFGKQLVSEEEVLNNISNIMMETYVGESLVLRVQKLQTMKGEAAVSLYRDIADVFIYDAADKIRKEACDAIYAFADAATAASLVKTMETLTKVAGVNTKDARRRIADRLIEDNAYKF
jgi:hypothetical protein